MRCGRGVSNVQREIQQLHQGRYEAILDQLTGPLCNAVTGQYNSLVLGVFGATNGGGRTGTTLPEAGALLEDHDPSFASFGELQGGAQADDPRSRYDDVDALAHNPSPMPPPQPLSGGPDVAPLLQYSSVCQQAAGVDE